MSYTIQYTQTKKAAAGKRRNGRGRGWIAAALLLALALVVRLMWPQVGEYAQKLLLLGVSDQNEEAVTAFIQDLRGGEDFSDALTAFCREVLQNGQTVE